MDCLKKVIVSILSHQYFMTRLSLCNFAFSKKNNLQVGLSKNDENYSNMQMQKNINKRILKLVRGCHHYRPRKTDKNVAFVIFRQCLEG